MLCAQGVAPAAATIERYRELGHELVPGTGPLAACVPGAFGGWLLLLREFGTWRLEDVLAFAIGYAERGYPVVAGITLTIERAEALLRDVAGVGGAVPPRAAPGNDSSATRARGDVRGGSSTSRAAARARTRSSARATVFYEGFVAEEIDRFSRRAGRAADRRRPRATGSATLESPATLDFRGLDGVQDGPVGPGPCLACSSSRCSTASTSRSMTRRRVRPRGDRVREARLRRPRRVLRRRRRSRSTRLLSRAYNDERRRLVGDTASDELRPGDGGRLPSHVAAAAAVGAGEPTRGDTVHLDVADRFGNLFSATPSGGWLQSSPVIPALGWPLGTRAQMFWLEEGLPSSLAPRTRPRTTLSPTIALRDGEPWLAYRHARRRPAGPVGAARPSSAT